MGCIKDTEQQDTQVWGIFLVLLDKTTQASARNLEEPEGFNDTFQQRTRLLYGSTDDVNALHILQIMQADGIIAIFIVRAVFIVGTIIDHKLMLQRTHR